MVIICTTFTGLSVDGKILTLGNFFSERDLDHVILKFYKMQRENYHKVF